MKNILCNISYMRLTGLFAIVAMLLQSSCIKNDIPYPRIAVEFLSISAKGEFEPAKIETDTKTVTLNLNEDVNLANVEIQSYKITENAIVKNPDLSRPIDLSSPVKVTTELYQEYVWTIKANQPIERYLNIQGQVGSSTIDVAGKRIVAYIPKTANLKRVQINSIKLGPKDITTMNPDLNGGVIVDFSTPIKVMVQYFDNVETWTLYVERTDVAVTTKSVDAWTNVIWAYGSAQVGKENGFEYKKESDATWTKVPSNLIVNDGGSFKARIVHLDPNTSYSVRATSGELVAKELTVTTQGYIELPNASLNDWWKNGKVWNPWAEGGVSFWDTGNKGASTLGESNSIPSDETWNGEPGKSAMLQTKFVGIGSIGKMAAGNLFSGEFIRVDGTNGILNFGRPFTGRPTKLKGYCKYKTSPINYASSELVDLKGRPDTAVVYMALTDWDAPYEIRTNPKNQQLFDKNSAPVIAYGEVKYGADINSFTQFEVELKYNATNRVPKYVVIVATSSKYGDYFTGGTGSVFYIDNLSLDWDYDN